MLNASLYFSKIKKSILNTFICTTNNFRNIVIKSKSKISQEQLLAGNASPANYFLEM